MTSTRAAKLFLCFVVALAIMLSVGYSSTAHFGNDQTHIAAAPTSGDGHGSVPTTMDQNCSMHFGCSAPAVLPVGFVVPLAPNAPKAASERQRHNGRTTDTPFHPPKSLERA